MGYDRILVPTDGEPASEHAAAHAAAFADAFDSTIHALYVLGLGEPPPGQANPEEHPEFKEQREHAFDPVVEQASQYDIPKIVEVVVRGDIGEAILTYAEDNDIDLIVMGTHGRDGIERSIVGSVAEHVVRNAAVPVVTVRPMIEGN